MDVNGTRFHLVFGRRDWESLGAGAVDSTVAYSPVREGVVLASLAERVERGEALGPDASRRRGAGVDRFGHIYWVSEDRRAVWFAPGVNAAPQLFWPRDVPCVPEPPADDFVPLEEPTVTPVILGGLAVTEDQLVVVGTIDRPGLLVFDVAAGGPPVWYRWPDAVAFEPFDLAPRPGGGVVVLDRRAGAWARLWALDARFRVVPWAGDRVLVGPRAEEFRPITEPTPPIRPAVTFPAGIALELAIPLDGPRSLAVEALSDGSVLVLEDSGGHSSVRRFSRGVETGVPLSLAQALVPLGLNGAAAAVLAQDFVFVRDAQATAPAGTLYLESADGLQVIAATLSVSSAGQLALVFLPLHLPLRLSGRRALVAMDGAVFHDRVDERWMLVSALPRPRFATSGTLGGRVFDGREPGCVWHRLLFDGCVPPGTSVEIDVRADDDDARVDERSWQRQPTVYRRMNGSEIPFTEPRGVTTPKDGGEGTYELLFQGIVGRYLELRVTLTGNTRATPVVRALRLHYPRFSYLHRYLPAIYREDRDSASLLERFLANPEGTFTELEGRIAAAQVLFDPSAVPVEWLEWLAGWMGVLYEPSWDEARRRWFLRNAHRLHRMRGTPAGLAAVIRLAIDPCPTDAILDVPTCCESRGARIVEHFLLRTRAGREVFAPETAVGGEGVRWRPSDGASALHRRWRERVTATYATTGALSAAWGRAVASFDALRFPALRPTQAAEASDWRAFVDAEIEPTYAEVEAPDVSRYRLFLVQRYGGDLDALTARWGWAPASFAVAQLPTTFPESASEITDWIDFVSRVLPIRDAAHRFTVLVPALPDEADSILEDRLSRVEAVVARERPAHTSFAIKLFWDLFRVGMVRVGVDTELGPGARFFPLVLDRRHLAEVYLDDEYPWHERDRRLVGRDPIFVLQPSDRDFRGIS